MELLESWAAWARQSQQPPFVLDQDREYLASARRTTVWPSWEAAHTHHVFEAPGDKSLHLGLLPFPFSGDLRRATVYILSLNPGVGPTDYYGEWDVREFREARLANLRQEFAAGQWPFVGLDPRFAWHGGFDYWHRQVGLRTVIAELARGWEVDFAEARRRLAHALAVVESFPYHSKDRAGTERLLQKLPSFELARRFVHEKVLPRVRDGEAIVIVLRQVKSWGLPKDLPGVIPYSQGETRRGSLSSNSRGGRRILKHLLSTNVVLSAEVQVETAADALTSESQAEPKSRHKPINERKRISATVGAPAGKRRCTHPDHNGDRLLPHTRDWFYRYPLPDGVTDADVESDPTLATWGSWCIDCRRADSKKKARGPADWLVTSVDSRRLARTPLPRRA